jgi:hypothetical protein
VTSGLKSTTRKTYASAQRQYLSFCNEYSLVSLPASEETLLMFVAQLYRKNCSYSTVNVYLAAVRALHVLEGLPDPLPQCLRLKLAIRAIGTSSGPPRQKLPLTMNILEKILSFLDAEASFNNHADV